MRTIILVLGISSSLLLLSLSKTDRTVYVCGDSSIYHVSTGHSALDKCTHTLYNMSESKAIKEGKRICKCRY
jgi:hypothetical protein